MVALRGKPFRSSRPADNGAGECNGLTLRPTRKERETCSHGHMIQGKCSVVRAEK
jgi:hypothetical protein